MKIVAIIIVLCGIGACYSVPVQRAFMYFPQSASYRTVQRTAYGAQFQNQRYRNQRVSDIASATNPNDCHNKISETAEVPSYDSSVDSTVDAYPSEQVPVEDIPEQDSSAVFETEDEEPLADVPIDAPIAPAVVPASIPDKKKKKVPAQVDSDEEEELDVQVGRPGSNGPAAPNAYFPINFGSSNGGAIAIANSHSTGAGGSATSTATAYGSPTAVELRRAARVQLREGPSALRKRQQRNNY